ncbi:HAUS augmin-like complex subunit 7 [Patagioenas fasciata]|uniref:HAUS augmin-like complex subunit 7 n=1 Tax=Patagioenas fasciata TaxID=372321 RepID=UPI003A99AE29
MAAAAAAAALERLEALCCPAVSALPPLSPPAALQLLCAPSALRLRLLEWLCARVYPPFAARLETLQDGPEDERLRELAKLGAELLLCRADETALLQGTAPPERQLQFIADLLDAAPPPGAGSGGSPRSSHSTLSRSRQLLHEVLETPEGGAALRTPPLPKLPLDGTCSPPRRAPRSLPALEAALGGAQRDLELLEAQSPELGGSPGAPRPLLRLLGVAGGDLGALATAFGAGGLWDAQGGPGGGGRPGHAPCGPLAPPAHRGLRTLVQRLQGVAQMRDTVAKVTQQGADPPHRTLGSRVAALQQRFGGDPGGAPQD